MTAWLVTGGAGFIGTNFVHMLAQRTDAAIVVLDALTYAGNVANISGLIDSGRIRFVRGDICARDDVLSLFAEHDFDRVVHFAAESHVDRSIQGPEAFLRVNIQGTYELLEASRACWAENLGDKRFLHVSTDEVYGSLGPDDAPFTEDSTYRPNSPYSASKAASDHLVRAWHHTYGLPTVITNCSNNYGPWQFPEKLIPLVILNALEGRELPIYGDGMQIRDWIHVEDHCSGIFAAIDHGVPGETYALGGDNECANLHLVEQICTIVDLQMNRLPNTAAQLIRYVTDRPGHDRRYAIDSTKASRELGWAPTRSLSDALGPVVRWYIENREWAAQIRSGAYAEYYEKQYAGR